ncbi:MAG: ATP phosphoribosyltransferase, partial [Alphaproteobacteria bacterium]|nr:ATP phosphoribosyltransferase [Alphaproteobacteria bacterium]
LGATEGTPAAGTAELIVDITSSGATLKANGLKIIEEGIILHSEANLIESRTAPWSPELRAVENDILKRLGV